MTYLTKLVDPIYSLLAAAAGCLAAFWVAAPELAQRFGVTALILVVLDTVVGGTVALRDRDFGSVGIGKVFVKLIAYLSAVVLVCVLDWALGIGYLGVVAVLALICYREGMSVLEHLANLGLPLPFLADRLEQLKRLSESEGGDESCDES